MENVYDKLQLLDCAGDFARPRDQKPITRWEFAAPGPNPSVQFALFLELCGWLVERATGDGKAFAVDKFDDPTTATNKLMLALRKLEFGADFSLITQHEKKSRNFSTGQKHSTPRQHDGPLGIRNEERRNEERHQTNLSKTPKNNRQRIN